MKKQEILKDFASGILRIAQKNLKAAGQLSPVVILFNPGYSRQEDIIPMTFGSEDEKRIKYGIVSALARVVGSMAVITVNDAKVFEAPTTDRSAAEEIFHKKYANSGDLANDPLAQDEIIITIVSPFFPHGCLLASEYHRKDSSGEIEFGESKFTEGTASGDVKVMSILPSWWTPEELELMMAPIDEAPIVQGSQTVN